MTCVDIFCREKQTSEEGFKEESDISSFFRDDDAFGLAQLSIKTGSRGKLLA